MSDDKQIFDEIINLRSQYIAEVGDGGRRAWPISIKSRVFELISRGHALKFIASRTQIPYETIGYWIQYEKKKRDRDFHSVKVLPGRTETSPVTVTVKSQNIPESSVVTVTVTTPDGFLIEGLPAHMVVDVLKARG